MLIDSMVTQGVTAAKGHITIHNWLGIQTFSVQVIKNLYNHATRLFYCQYINYSEVGFIQ